jgi:hypothetical protein
MEISWHLLVNALVYDYKLFGACHRLCPPLAKKKSRGIDDKIIRRLILYHNCGIILVKDHVAGKDRGVPGFIFSPRAPFRTKKSGASSACRREENKAALLVTEQAYSLYPFSTRST